MIRKLKAHSGLVLVRWASHLHTDDGCIEVLAGSSFICKESDVLAAKNEAVDLGF